MLHMPVDVIASFNVEGRIKPGYIRIEDEEGSLHTYKIVEVLSCREEKYAGVPVMLFRCSILREGHLQLINIKYHIKTHQWVITGDDRICTRAE